MCPILIILISSLFYHTRQASSSTQLWRNYFVASGKNMINPSSVVTQAYQTYYYTSSFPQVLEDVASIYYTTAEIQARTNDNDFPGTGGSPSSRKKFVWYQIENAEYSRTHIKTAISGYFERPYVNYFTFFYLIVLANNPFIGKYVVIEELAFFPDSNSSSISYPTAYQTGHVITLTPMLKQVKTIYLLADLKNYIYDSQTFVQIQWTHVAANLSVNVAIDLPSYIYSERNYSIKYLVILMDKTAIGQELIRYRFTSDYLNSGINKDILKISLPQNPLNSDTNVLFGLAQYSYYNDKQNSLYFTITYSNNQLQVQFRGSLNKLGQPSTSYSYSYAFLPYYDCPNNYFIYNSTNNLCYDACLQTNQYYDNSLRQCRTCHFTCLTCYDSNQCRTCDTALAFRHLVNITKCTPIDGYFQSNTTIASKCSLICVLCEFSAANCTKCLDSSQALINNTCVKCYSIIEGCSSCNSFTCFACNSSYSFYNQTYCNLPCVPTYCLLCSNRNTSRCFMCSVGYVLIGGLCQMNVPVKTIVCGDLVIDMGEECDDGNLINRDGCNSQCKVEQFYQCYSTTTSQGYSYTNYCAYTHAIDFALISIEKLSYSNSLRILLSVKQYQELFWNTRSTLSHFLVETPIPYRNMEVSFLSRSPSSVKLTQKLSPTLVSKHPQSSVIAVTFEYLQSIHGQTITLSFNFSQSSDYALTQIPVSNVTLEAVPDNNHYAALYSSQTYSQQKTLSNALLFVAVAAVFVMILTLFVGSKRISTEMLTVIQVAYASLLTAPKVSPLFSAVTSLSAANNGFNLMYSAQLRPFEDTLISNRAKGAQLYSQFLYNFNVGTLFVVLPLFVGVVLFVVSKVRDSDEEGQKRAQRRFQLALGEFTFAGLTFGSCIVGVASVLEVQFGMKEMGTTVGMMSLLAAVLFLFLYAIYGVIRAKSIFLFEEYSGVLLNENFSLGFHLVYFYLGLFTGALLCGLCGFAWVNCAAAVLPLGLYCVTLAKPVFRKQMDRLRTQLNLLTIVLLQAPFLYVNLRDGQAFYSEDDAVLLVPITVAILLLLNLVINFLFVVYQVIKKVRDSINRGQVKKNMSKQQAQMQKQYKMVPQYISKQFEKPMLINSFIEYSQAEEKQLIQLNLLKPQSVTPKSIINQLKSNKFQYSSMRKKVEEQKHFNDNTDQI